MVSTGANLILCCLSEGGSSELRRKQYERVFEQSSLLQISKQRGDWLVDAASFSAVILFDVFVSS